MKISCPHCNVNGVVEDSYAGRRVKCPACDGSFKVPIPEPEPPAVDPAAEMIAVDCPHCGTTGSVDSAHLGRKIRCPQCHWLFIADGDGLIPGERVLEGSAELDPANPMEELYPGTEVPVEEELPGAALLETAEMPAETVYSARESGTGNEDDDLFLDALPGRGDFESRSEEPAEELDEYDEEFTAAAVGESAGAAGVAAAAGAGAAATLAARRAAMEDRTFEEEEEESEGSDHWTIGWALSRAWQKTRGVKTVLILQGLLLALVAAAGQVGNGVLLSMSGITQGFLQDFLQALQLQQPGADPRILLDQLNFSPALSGGMLLLGLVVTAVTWAISGGMIYTAICRTSGRQVSFGLVGRGFKHMGRIFLALFLIGVLTSIGFMLFLLPGLYLMVAWSMTVPLIVDRHMGVWKAMESSRRAVTRHWFKIFVLLCLLMPMLVFVFAIPCVISFILMLPMTVTSIFAILFVISLVWTLPMTFVLMGVIYNAIFGE